MFGLVFLSDGQNEGPLIMALIFIAQLVLPLVWSNLDLVTYAHVKQTEITPHKRRTS